MPYITASIIMQILAVVIPKLEQWQEQGAVGQRKITQWTRYLTVAIAIMQATGLTFLFHKGGGGFSGGNPTELDLFAGNVQRRPRSPLVVLTLTAGTPLLMWMGELVTQRGIGNGMSILIFASVVSRLPANFGAVKAREGHRRDVRHRRHVHRCDGGHRVHGAGPAPDPRAVRQARGRPHACTAARAPTSRSRSTAPA